MNKVVTGKVRLSYVHLFEAYAFDSAPDKKLYSVCVIIDKDDKQTISKVKAAIKQAIEDGKTSKWKNKIPANMWNPLRDGDEERPDDDAFRGKFFINAKSTKKPGVVDKDLNKILDPEELYSGVYGRVSISFFPFNVSGNQGIGAGLNNVQKLSDGERLGGGSNAKTDFDDDFKDEPDENLDDVLEDLF